MATSTQWQLAREAAERYQTILTPTILGPFAGALVGFATLQPGERVVDIGCGTGAAARYAAEAVGASGYVMGVDVNASMIDVARSLPAAQGSPVEWHEATATQLPLRDQSMDVALCAQALQFLPEKGACLSEMHRVLKPGGRLALSLWCELEDNPYFYTLVAAIARHIGPETAAGLNAAFALSDTDVTKRLLKEAGFTTIDTAVTQLDLSLPPLAEFVPRHISATPMAAGFGRAPTPVQQALIREVIEQLSTDNKGSHAQIPFKSYMIMCRN